MVNDPTCRCIYHLTLKWLEGVSFDQNGEMATERRI